MSASTSRPVHGCVRAPDELVVATAATAVTRRRATSLSALSTPRHGDGAGASQNGPQR